MIFVMNAELQQFWSGSSPLKLGAFCEFGCKIAKFEVYILLIYCLVDQRRVWCSWKKQGKEHVEVEAGGYRQDVSSIPGGVDIFFSNFWRGVASQVASEITGKT